MAQPLAEQLDALLAEASFRVETVVDGYVRQQWVPLAHRSHCDKIYAVLSGKARARLEDEEYGLSGGDVLLFPSGTIQQGDTDAADPMRKIWVHFESATTQTLQLLRLFPPPRALRGESAAQVLELAQQLHAEWRGQGAARQLALKSLLMRILLVAYRAPASDHRPPDRRIPKAEAKPSVAENTNTRLPVDRIRDVLAQMTRNFGDDLALTDLAAAAHLHPTYFTQVFKRLVGMPPMKYLEQLRLRRAQELLARTQRPVAEVAETVGYRDPYYFSRAFSRLTGIAPTKYREEAQRGETKNER